MAQLQRIFYPRPVVLSAKVRWQMTAMGWFFEEVDPRAHKRIDLDKCLVTDLHDGDKAPKLLIARHRQQQHANGESYYVGGTCPESDRDNQALAAFMRDKDRAEALVKQKALVEQPSPKDQGWSIPSIPKLIDYSSSN